MSSDLNRRQKSPSVVGSGIRWAHPAVDSPDPGPAGFTGSLVVVEFDSLEDAQVWADADPYIAAGVYRKVTVKPFNRVLP